MRGRCFRPFGSRAAPRQRHVRHRQPLAASRVRHHFRLIWRHHLVLEALKEDERRRQPIGEVNGRSRAVDVARGGIRTDERIEVARFEFVRVLRQHLDIADPVVAGTGRERVVKGQCRQRGVAAGAAPADDQALGIGLTPGDKLQRPVDAIGDVHEAPASLQAIAIRAPKAGAAAVVDVEDRKPAAGPELNARVEDITGSGCRAAVAQDHQRRPLIVRRGVVGALRRVIERVHRRAVGVEGDRLRRRNPRISDAIRSGGADDRGPNGR